ncbi:MAG: hypothetical protein ACI36W_01825 [Coriobacteriales bacterium]
MRLRDALAQMLGMEPGGAAQDSKTPPAPDVSLIKEDGCSILFDDTVRTWREDAQAYMTDWEHTDWYEGYYYTPDGPY